MALSKEAKRSYKKAQKVQKKQRRNKHWLFIRYGDSKKEVASKIMTQLCCIVLICSVIVLWDYFKAIYVNSKLNSSLQSLYTEITDVITSNEEGTLLPNAETLIQINPDTVGWIKIDDTKVDNVVVLHPNDNPQEFYYLTHNFYGEEAKAGTIFADYRTTLRYKKQSDNVVLYGHNEKDNSMFGDLDKYKNDLEFYKAHPIIHFNSNYEIADYKIISCFVTSTLENQSADGTVFDYQNYIDFDEARYNDFISNVMVRSQIITPVDYQYGDKFLTLSTCSNEFSNSRFIVVARKIRDGEDSFVDTESAYKNDNAKEPDWDTIYGK